MQQYQQQKDTEAILKEQVLTELIYLVKSLKGQKETVRLQLIFSLWKSLFARHEAQNAGVKLLRETRS